MPRKSPAYYLVQLEAMACARGGVLLSRAYLGNATKLRFRCVEGHQWLATPSTVKQGRWCPACWLPRAAAKNTAHGQARLRRAVARHGGTIVSRHYLGTKSQLRFRCRQGHEWRTAPGTILGGCWCPDCAIEHR